MFGWGKAILFLSMMIVIGCSKNIVLVETANRRESRPSLSMEKESALDADIGEKRSDAGVGPDDTPMDIEGDPTASGEQMTNQTGSRALWDHGQFLSNFALSPNDRYIATVGRLGNIRIWDTKEETEVASIPSPQDPAERNGDNAYTVNDLDFTRDNRLLIYGDSEGTLHAFDLERKTEIWREDRTVTGRPVDPEEGNLNDILGVACSPEEDIVVAGNEYGMITIHESGSGRRIKRYGKSQTMDRVQDIAFSKNGRFFTVLRGGSVQIWRTRTPIPIKEYQLLDRRRKFFPDAAAYSPDGAWIVVGGELVILMISTNSKTRKEISYSGYVYSLGFSPDGRFLAGAGDAGCVFVYELETGLSNYFSKGDEGAACRKVAFTSNGIGFYALKDGSTSLDYFVIGADTDGWYPAVVSPVSRK